MTDHESRIAYSHRAAEYIQVLGSMAAVHPLDRQIVSSWADEVEGELIDAGCGPGHWTNFLAERGASVRGIDQVPEFIAHARSAYPTVDFELGRLDSLGVDTGGIGGLLSWYSLIHVEPESILVPLREFARAVRPGGTVLIGFLEGPAVEEYAHAVLTAYLWSVDDLATQLNTAGFDLVESHVRKTTGQRSQGAIVARRRSAVA